MKKNKSIALICCYVGKLPWYFNYFIHTCEYNPSVVFYIIADDISGIKSLPANVKFIHLTMDQIRDLAAEKLGFKVVIREGYKLCDFKPAYGIIFSEFLKGYDFWGYCDIDIVFGDIREFVTEQLLENYDLISVRPDWIPGCFLIYKNSLRMNKLYTESKDYKKVFTNGEHFCFDETNFSHSEFEKGKAYNEIDSEVESMMHVVKRLEAERMIKPYFNFHIIEGGCPGRLKWEKGKLLYSNQFEILLYHLIDLKRHINPKKMASTIPEKFSISPTTIYHR